MNHDESRACTAAARRWNWRNLSPLPQQQQRRQRQRQLPGQRWYRINNCVIAGPELRWVGFGEMKTKRQIIFSHLGANRRTFWYKRPGFCGVQHTERAKTTFQSHAPQQRTYWEINFKDYDRQIEMELTVGTTTNCSASGESCSSTTLFPFTAYLHLLHAAVQHPHLQTHPVQRQAHILLWPGQLRDGLRAQTELRQRQHVHPNLRQTTHWWTSRQTGHGLLLCR